MIKKFYVFVVTINGDEKIAMYPDENGGMAPLIYLSKDGISQDNMRVAVQKMADESKLYFELREYALVNDSHTEEFYPSTKKYDA